MDWSKLLSQLENDDGNWVLNPSFSELADILHGKFASICRNMTSVQYNFFLAEMVHLRNIWRGEKVKNQDYISHLQDIHL